MLLQVVKLANKFELFLEQQRSGCNAQRYVRHCLTSLLLDGHLTLGRDERLYVFVIPWVCLGWCVGLLQLHLESCTICPWKHPAFVLKAAFSCKLNYEWRLYLQLD